MPYSSSAASSTASAVKQEDENIAIQPDCCWCFSGKAGVIMIASILIAVAIFSLVINAIYQGGMLEYVVDALHIIFAIIAIVGAVKYSPFTIIVYATWLILGTLVAIVQVGLAVSEFLATKDTLNEIGIKPSYIFLMSLNAFITVTSVYFSYFVVKYAIYLKKVEKEARRVISTPRVRSHNAGGV